MNTKPSQKKIESREGIVRMISVAYVLNLSFTDKNWHLLWKQNNKSLIQKAVSSSTKECQVVFLKRKTKSRLAKFPIMTLMIFYLFTEMIRWVPCINWEQYVIFRYCALNWNSFSLIYCFLNHTFIILYFVEFGTIFFVWVILL